MKERISEECINCFIKLALVSVIKNEAKKSNCIDSPHAIYDSGIPNILGRNINTKDN